MISVLRLFVRVRVSPFKTQARLEAEIVFQRDCCTTDSPWSSSSVLLDGVVGGYRRSVFLKLHYRPPAVHWAPVWRDRRWVCSLGRIFLPKAVVLGSRPTPSRRKAVAVPVAPFYNATRGRSYDGNQTGANRGATCSPIHVRAAPGHRRFRRYVGGAGGVGAVRGSINGGTGTFSDRASRCDTCRSVDADAALVGRSGRVPQRESREKKWQNRIRSMSMWE